MDSHGGDGLIGDHTLNEREQNRSHLPQREASACPQLREINQFVEGAGYALHPVSILVSASNARFWSPKDSVHRTRPA